MNTNITPTAAVAAVEELGKFCATRGLGALIQGKINAGTTYALMNLRSRYKPDFQLPGSLHYHCFASQDDPIRALRAAFSRAQGVPKKANEIRCIDEMTQICFDLVVRNDIRLLVLDRCDNVSHECLNPILDLISLCKTADQPHSVGVLLAGRDTSNRLHKWDLCDMSKIAKKQTLPLLPEIGDTLGVLTQWSKRFKRFTADVQANKKADVAVAVAEEIHINTNGCIGELHLLWTIIDDLQPAGEVTLETIKAALLAHQRR